MRFNEKNKKNPYKLSKNIVYINIYIYICIYKIKQNNYG